MRAGREIVDGHATITARTMRIMTSPFTIDEGTAFGARAAHRLRTEVVIWLTTVGASGAPSSNPVWFLWDGADKLSVHNLPGSARVRHLQADPHVGLHFDGDGRGGDIVVLSALAELRPDDPKADADPAFVAKYAADIERIRHTPQSFAAQYSLPIVLTLTGLRGH